MYPRSLPQGCTHLGCRTHSRSFAVAGEANSSTRAQLTESQATSQVVAWLWEWYNKGQADQPSKKKKKGDK